MISRVTLIAGCLLACLIASSPLWSKGASRWTATAAQDAATSPPPSTVGNVTSTGTAAGGQDATFAADSPFVIHSLEIGPEVTTTVTDTTTETVTDTTTATETTTVTETAIETITATETATVTETTTATETVTDTITATDTTTATETTTVTDTATATETATSTTTATDTITATDTATATTTATATETAIATDTETDTTTATTASASQSSTAGTASAGPALMQPFPVVHIAGNYSRHGVNLRVLSVQAPAGATVLVTCGGRGCPAHRQRVRVPASSRGESTISFARFEHPLPAGLTVRVKVFAAGKVGKLTSLLIRRGKPPVRSDTCLGPSGLRAMSCAA